MPNKPPNQRAKQSAAARVQSYRKHDARRGSSTERGYGAEWRRTRLQHLAEHPLCVMCLERGFVTSATVVDHIKPHRGDPALFWDRTNWQSLCAPDHDSVKQREERAGV